MKHSPDNVALHRITQGLIFCALLLVPCTVRAQRSAIVRATTEGLVAVETVTVASAAPVAGALHRPPLVIAWTDFLHPDTATLRVLAGRVDRLLNGDPVLWRADNPNVEQYNYRLFYSVLITGADSMSVSGIGVLDAWLIAHGYPIESAFLHMKDSTATKAHRLTWFLPNSNGDSSTALNMADAGVRAWQLSIVNDLKARGYAGVFYDIFGRGIMARLFSSAEGDSLWYRAVLTDALRAERAASGMRIIINTASYNTPFDSLCIVAAGGAHLERTNYPLGQNNAAQLNYWRWVDHLVAAGVERIEFVSNLAWFDKVPAAVGNDVTPMGREKMAEYAGYLMVKDTGTIVAFAMDNYWRNKPDTMTQAAWDTSIVNAKNHWLAAWDTVLGRPLGARVQMASGVDPIGQSYSVWRREYERAVVVMRTTGKTPTEYGDTTEVPVSLGVALRVLRSDGTLVAPDSTVRLRAGEGVVLMR